MLQSGLLRRSCKRRHLGLCGCVIRLSLHRPACCVNQRCHVVTPKMTCALLYHLESHIQDKRVTESAHECFACVQSLRVKEKEASEHHFKKNIDISCQQAAHHNHSKDTAGWTTTAHTSQAHGIACPLATQSVLKQLLSGSGPVYQKPSSNHCARHTCQYPHLAYRCGSMLIPQQQTTHQQRPCHNNSCHKSGQQRTHKRCFQTGRIQERAGYAARAQHKLTSNAVRTTARKATAAWLVDA